MTGNETTEGHALPGGEEPQQSVAGARDAAEADLYESFVALRSRDASLVPDFDSLVGRPLRIRAARPRPVWSSSLRLALPLAAAAALVLVFTRPGPDDAFTRAVLAYTTSPALGAWSSPTEFLLHTPGSELLKRAPDIGRTTVWPAMPDVRGAFRDTTQGG